MIACGELGEHRVAGTGDGFCDVSPWELGAVRGCGISQRRVRAKLLRFGSVADRATQDCLPALPLLLAAESRSRPAVLVACHLEYE